MSPDELAAIRERADHPILGKSMAVVLDQAVRDQRALLDLVDSMTEDLDTARRLRDKLTRIGSDLSERISAVLELHSPVGSPDQYCQHCEHNYPCPTRQAALGNETDGT